MGSQARLWAPMPKSATTTCSRRAMRRCAKTNTGGGAHVGPVSLARRRSVGPPPRPRHMALRFSSHTTQAVRALRRGPLRIRHPTWRVSRQGRNAERCCEAQHWSRPQELEETSADGAVGTMRGAPQKVIDLDEFAEPDASTAVSAQPPGPLPSSGCASLQEQQYWVSHCAHRTGVFTHSRTATRGQQP